MSMKWDQMISQDYFKFCYYGNDMVVMLKETALLKINAEDFMSKRI